MNLPPSLMQVLLEKATFPAGEPWFSIRLEDLVDQRQAPCSIEIAAELKGVAKPN